MSEPPVSTEDQIRRAVAEQKSFVGSAVVVLLLYLLCYIPGLIFNIMWMNEARAVKKVTGRSPHGSGCLGVMFFIGISPWLMLLLIFIVTPSFSEARKRAQVIERSRASGGQVEGVAVATPLPTAAAQNEAFIPKLNIAYTSKLAFKIFPSIDAAPPADWRSGEMELSAGCRFVFLRGPTESAGEYWYPVRVTSSDGRNVTGWFRDEQLTQPGALEISP